MEIEIEVSGKVQLKKFGTGSKSEHDAVFLETKEDTYVLRRVGGNPFSDGGLLKWVGKSVVVTGILYKNIFLANNIKEIKVE